MATIVLAGTPRVLKFNAGSRIEKVLATVAEEFGECAHEFRQLRHSDGSIIFQEENALLPDGEYTYDAVRAPAAVAPSSFNYSVLMEKQMGPEPEFLNFMPPTAVPPLPLQLLHSAFGQFLDNIERCGSSLAEPMDVDYDHYTALVLACSSFYKEEGAMREELRKIWRKYFGLQVMDEMYTGSNKRGNSATDLGIREAMFDALVLLIEAKRGISTSHTEVYMQALINYDWNWNKARPSEKKFFSDTVFPALILQHVGQLLLVGGAVMLPDEKSGDKDKLCYQPFTTVELVPIHGHHVSTAMKGVRTCMAIKAAVEELVEYYGLVGDVNKENGGVYDPAVRELLRMRIPQPLLDEAQADSVKRLGNKLVYVLSEPGKEPTVVKYCQSYGGVVHQAWAAKGFAPKLLSLEKLPGGWLEVRTEYLAEEDGWKVLFDVKDADSLREDVVKELKKAHKVQVGNSPQDVPTYGVHGDMRDNNVMVRTNENGKVEVRFIDFDWAREEGLQGSCYPGFMNHIQINWPRGVKAGRPMLQEHDVHLLSLQQAKQLKQGAAVSDAKRRKVTQRKATGSAMVKLSHRLDM